MLALCDADTPREPEPCAQAIEAALKLCDHVQVTITNGAPVDETVVVFEIGMPHNCANKAARAADGLVNILLK